MSMVFLSVIVMLIGGLNAPESGLIFDHSAHVIEQDMECVTCHSGVEDSELSSDRNLPDHETCSDCHEIEEEPTNCGYCHTNSEDPTGTTLPETELIYSHKGHLNKAVNNDLCLTCHIGLNTLSTGQTSAHPVMQDCFSCHDGSEVSSECSVCHTKVEEMTMLVHDPGWEHEHKFTADLGGKSCLPCHQPETFCSSCHAGDNLVETVHELNYRDSHGLDARNDEILCQTCHEPEIFCSSCHAGAGHRPFDHLASDWGSPLNAHGEAAQQDAESCAACHSGAISCVICHSEWR